MKLYIFLTSLIRGVGGGHIYTLNKIHYLNDLGWDTKFIHADKGSEQIIIEELRLYKKCCDIHLQRPPYMFTHSVQEKTLEHLCSILGDLSVYSEIIIESQTIDCALWGELLAKRIKAKNFVFLLGELLRTKNSMVYDFWKFKLGRKELYGIGADSLKNLLNGWNKDGLDLSFTLKARCSNTVDNVPYSKLPSFPKTDYVIGMIGRIDKKYVEICIQSINKFASSHQDKTFSLILIGGTNNKKIHDRIEKIASKEKNVFCHITGLIYPIPLELVRYCDVFVSTAGSAWVSANLGIPTISCDVEDFLPIGVLKQTTNNTLYRSSNEPPLDMEYLLEDVLLQHKYSIESCSFIPQKFVFDDHLDALENTDHRVQYYDTSIANICYLESFVKWITRIFGVRISNNIIQTISMFYVKYLK